MSDSRRLPHWIDAFLRYTDNTEPPYLFRKWTAISCVAAALQRKVYVDWGTSLVFYPNFYIILVGPSATGKGTAMRPGFDILNEITGVKLASEATSLQALIKTLQEASDTDINMDTGEQTWHSSLTIFSEEFTVFLGYQNRELMAALCNWYDCQKKWTYRTIARDQERVTGVWVNMIGGTTPDLIRSSLPQDSIGGGLTSRIIFVYEEKPEKLITLPMQTAEEKQLGADLQLDLEKISMMSGQYRWTTGFASLWDDFCREDRANPPFQDPKFDGYNGRRRTHLMKLAMVISASYSAELILRRDHLEEAIDYLLEVEIKMPLTFKGMGKSSISELIYETTKFICAFKGDAIPYWQFARHFETEMDAFTMKRVLDTLEAARIARYIHKGSTDPYIQVLDAKKLLK